MDAATRELVRRRAGNRCEYCLRPQEHAETTHHIEHIVARQHLGTDDPLNLALACIHCNYASLRWSSFLESATKQRLLPWSLSNLMCKTAFFFVLFHR
jgi:5-methylcytosine-specific restriction endonuclease McrA